MMLTHDTLKALVLIIVVCPLVEACLGLWLPRYSLMVGSLISVAATLTLVADDSFHSPLRFVFGFGFYLDALSAYFLLLINVVAIFATWYLDWRGAGGVDIKPPSNLPRFRALFGTFQFSIVLVPMVNDLFVLWLVIEATTVLSVLLLLQSVSKHAPEAALKYFYVTIPGLIFAFVGMVIVAMALPPGGALSWSDLVQIAGRLDPRLVSLAFVFSLLGYGAKAGLAPQHTWLPDVHGEASAPVSAMLSGVLLTLALFAILRWTTITNLALGSVTFTSHLFLGFGALSLIISTLAILKANRFKRVLAYSSLEHMGIIAFGLGVGTPLAIFGVLLHALGHALTKEFMFLTLDNIQRAYQAADKTLEPKQPMPDDDDGIRGAFKATPGWGALLALGGLSLAGSPPFNLFLSELIILWAALRSAMASPNLAIISSTVIFVVSTTLVFGGLINHLGRILLDVPSFTQQNIKGSLLAQPWLLYVLLGLILIFGLTVPAIGSLNIPHLLTRGSCIVLEGAVQCH